MARLHLSECLPSYEVYCTVLTLDMVHNIRGYSIMLLNAKGKPKNLIIYEIYKRVCLHFTSVRNVCFLYSVYFVPIYPCWCQSQQRVEG